MIDLAQQIKLGGVDLEEPQPNDLSYVEIAEWEKLAPTGDHILVDWEEAKSDLPGGLIRPDTHKKLHYTGIVLATGPEADAALEPGVRIIFDQFSNFQKLWNTQVGRMALISERAQGSGFAIIPHRTKVGNGQGDYNYEA